MQSNILLTAEHRILTRREDFVTWCRCGSRYGLSIPVPENVIIPKKKKDLFRRRRKSMVPAPWVYVIFIYIDVNPARIVSFQK